MRLFSSRQRRAAALVLGTLLATTSPSEAAQRRTRFRNPQPVEILGYSGDAMEPFLGPRGEILLFNDSNAPGLHPDLHVADRLDDLTFRYRGPLSGANSASLDAVPSFDRAGRLIFVSLRSYFNTLSSLYQGWLVGGEVRSVRLLAGVSRHQPGWINMDAGISPDGSTLYFVDALFSSGNVPDRADLVIARRRGAEFERLADSAALLAAVNSAALEYAPAISAGGRELFFTRLVPGAPPQIFRSTRRDTAKPFGPPRRVAAARGFVEAPTLSPDGRSMLYHRRQGGTFRLYRVTRRRSPADR